MLAALDPLEDDTLVPFSPGEEAAHLASRFRFDDASEPVEAFFTRWVETYCREWGYEQELEAGDAGP